MIEFADSFCGIYATRVLKNVFINIRIRWRWEVYVYNLYDSRFTMTRFTRIRFICNITRLKTIRDDKIRFFFFFIHVSVCI